MRVRAPRRPATSPRLVPAVLLGLALAVLPGIGVAADTGNVTWGVRAADNEHGSERRNYAYQLEGGQSLQDAITVTNHSDAPLSLDLYAADGFTTTSGELDLLPRSETSTGVGSWITLGAADVVIEPGESRDVGFTVAVPADVPPGDYAGGVVTSLRHAGAAQGITVDRRLGIRVHLRVGGELAPRLLIENAGLTYDGALSPFDVGVATATFTVHNAGNARLAAGAAVTLSGPFGLFPATAQELAAIPELLPGDTWTIEVAVPGVVPAFLLTADVAATPEVVAVASADGLPALDAVHAAATVWAVPWTLLVLVVLIAAGMTAWLRARRRRRRGEAARIEAAVAAALNDRERTDAAVVS
ncbi:WxL protein peptidoglycan domain-containing protein [Microbacterium ulmi]|uniref:DUF916 domain-containing protein n=1 Tax=Microbacterium ulmi TaxID=179095 RepID=A0A7Y2M008_9MICO|nr:DUF916 domain-containing protein [Microbacterium ulmi]NII68961.1 hypothetical protein [Microbacterium ulmi]NNH03944.1 DUF916 domain-containing protein [Microbacterium ulmi]